MIDKYNIYLIPSRLKVRFTQKHNRLILTEATVFQTNADLLYRKKIKSGVHLLIINF
jgi:hypothetical protein